MKKLKLKVSQLVEDFDLYPRASVDATHVQHIALALEAGCELPPVVICAKSYRIVDGFHRSRAIRRVLGKNAEIEVIAKDYKNESQLFLEAMMLNANHGRNMTPFDRTHAIQKAVKFEIDPQLIAAALNMKIDRISFFKQERCAKLENSRTYVPLKMPIRHMRGQTITKEQSEIIPKLGGNQQMFFINQLIMLIENDMFDWSKEKAIERLDYLSTLIGRSSRKAA